VWRVPWLAGFRVVALVLLAGAAKVVGDIGVGDATVRRVAIDVQWPALLLAAAIAVHPFLVRWLFRRTRYGLPVTVAWAGRDRSGQPWLVLRSPTGPAWRVRPRPGPVDYPLPRWRGTPWVYPPEVDSLPVPGTLVRPGWTRRRGLVLHRTTGGPAAGAQDIYVFGTEPLCCQGLHLRSVRRLRHPR
jgi:hypothetical protein